MAIMLFPKNFLWGAAASAPQTEGHSSTNGKSPSIWDKWFEIAPDKFYQRQGPENTSDVYDLYLEDVANMAKLGLNSYRTSIAWTRLMPDGVHVNPEAVTFYRQYFQALLDHHIEPIINLFHFDMPWWLMARGGWESREAVSKFANYAQVAFEQFGDLVKRWVTFNEPLVQVKAGYLYGFHYPAVVNFRKAVQVGYHMLLAHTFAVQAFRQANIAGGQIGIILDVTPVYAKTESASDQRAQRAADLLNIRSFLDPAVLGHVPDDLLELLEVNQLTPISLLGDGAAIAAYTVDFIGLNYYRPKRVQAPTKPATPAKMPNELYEDYEWPARRINPYRGWEIYPEALYDVAIMMRDQYGNIPWFVSENGMGVANEARFKDASGHINDQYRIDFMKEHLQYLHKGIAAGSNCFGYHTWTFVDCWSWLNGYHNRYGLYSVDLDHHYQRQVKQSGLWFKQLITDNGF
ncbi:beta-glucosidase [Agrilactobacillus composti DSM 18527 = JCM 14202]|uniref:Beta-glucosidase n=2 Tax=Agrilactobacillus TaxID=2767875 RepID=A0A0R1Y1T1_9LACO|nr:beta-glucosidase [Agrilactobacillus composti DSM 18527 = JCM 14202]